MDRPGLIFLTLLAFGLAGGEFGPSGGEARAGIVYEQPPQYPSMQSAWSSSYDQATSTSIYQTYDNFALTQTATITDVAWQGLSFNSSTLGAPDSLVTSFYVSFYANSGGVPGQMLFCEMIQASQQAAGPTDLFNNGQTETVYNYEGAIGGFTATAGTTYWISIQGITDASSIWTWTSGTGGDGTSYQQVSPGSGGGSYVRPGDRTFTLLATPEPPSIALCGIAAGIGLAGVRLLRGRGGKARRT